MSDRFVKKTLACLLIPVLLLAALSGCSPAEDAPTPVPETPGETTPVQAPSEELSEDIAALPMLAVEPDAGFDPYTTDSACNRLALELVLEPLFVVTETGELRSVLAESWTVTPDGSTTQVVLRKDATFHDGTPLTASIVAESVRRASAGGIYSGRFYALESVEATATDTVTFTTSKAYECFPLLLDIPIVLDGSLLPVGTGPYRWDKLECLMPYEGWWGENYPAGERVVELLSVSDAAQLRDGFQYGGVTGVCVDPNGAGVAHYTGEYELWNVPTTIMQYVGFNLDKGVFSSKKLRTAVTWAVDRERIVTEDLSGFGVPAVLATLPGSVWDVPELAAGKSFDPAGLTASLTSSGLSATMIVSSENAQRLLSAERIARQLTDCGIYVTVNALPAADFRKALQKGEFDLYYAEVRLSPTLDLSPFFAQNGSLAFGGLTDAGTEALCDLILANRGNSYDLQNEILQEGLLCPVAFKTTACYLHRGVMQPLSPNLGGWLWQ